MKASDDNSTASASLTQVLPIDYVVKPLVGFAQHPLAGGGRTARGDGRGAPLGELTVGCEL